MTSKQYDYFSEVYRLAVPKPKIPFPNSAQNLNHFTKPVPTRIKLIGLVNNVRRETVT